MSTTTDAEHPPRRAARAALWLPGLLVAVGAAVVTAHGLYEVARAAGTPPLIAGLYPLITDGLALVAYAATSRLAERGRRYAWTVVVLAAGLSGLAQASYLAQGVAHAPSELRFGVGAWPAIAAAIVAHLLFLIATAERPTAGAEPTTETEPATEPEADAAPSADTSNSADEPDRSAVQRTDVQLVPYEPEPVQPEPVQPEPVQPALSEPATHPLPVVQPVRTPVQPNRAKPAATSARERADQAAEQHEAEHGSLPTVTRLMELADVSRGTAGEALKARRNKSAPLHLVDEHNYSEAHQ